MAIRPFHNHVECVSETAHLGGVDKLRDRGQIHLLLTVTDSIRACGLCRLPLQPLLPQPPLRLWAEHLRRCRRRRVIIRQLMCRRRHITGHIRIHGNHIIRNIKKRARTAGNQNRRHPLFRKQRANPLHKWGDGLILRGNQLLHPPVPNHEVRGRRILINEQR